MSSSLTTAWCPSSSQLRLAFNCRRTSTVSVQFLRFQKLDYRRHCFRIYSVAGAGNSVTSSNGNGSGVVSNGEREGRRLGDSWTKSNSLADDFAGWSGAEQSGDDSKSKQSSIGGIVGAGLAGVFLVAGLTFAALSIGKKRTSRVKPQTEPLSTQLETSLAADDHDERSQEEGNKSINDMQELSNEESKTGIDNNSSLYIDNSEAVESRISDDVDLEHTSNEGDMTSDDKIKLDLQNETAKDGTSVDSEDTSQPPENGGDSLVVPSSGIKDGSFSESKDVSFPAGKPESVVEPEKVNFADETNQSIFDATTINLSSDNQQGVSGSQETESAKSSLNSSPNDSTTFNIVVSSQFDSALEPKIMVEDEKEEKESFSVKEGTGQTLDVSAERDNSSPEVHNLNKAASTGSDSIPPVAYSLANEEGNNGYNDNNVNELSFDSTNSGNFFTSAGVPAPSLVSAALQTLPGKVLVPASVDQVHSQALAALQVLKVIEADVRPGDLCTRREYARWLVSASSALSRNTISKVYPAMYIENVSELAFDDITPDDPDFPSIQGLAEAGLISSKLSRRDMQASLDEEQNPLYFSPESALCRQDLVSWKMATERRQLPVVNRKSMEQLSGFIDIDKIHPDAWPALAADIAAGEQGIIAPAFGYTRLFQPDKPVTKAQAAVALSTGEASDIVNEELARIEAESMAEKAVAAHSDLVAQVEKDINASFEKELILEKKRIDTVERMAEETRQELERLKSQREEENLALMRERAAVDSEMEVLSRLRREVEEQLQTIMSNKVEISYEKERLNKLREDAEIENKEIARLQYELEVERKALSMARDWAEDEAKRAREQAKALEEARGRWERQGIKVVVDDDLREESDAAVNWVSAAKEVSVEGTIDRAENLVDKLKRMADVVTGKCKDTINLIIQKILFFISVLKDQALKAGKQAGELKDAVFAKMSGSLQEVQHSSAEFTSAAKEGIKRVLVDAKEGVEKFTQKFKA